MANYKTGAQRYNDRMDKIFERAKSEGRGLVGDSKTKGHGVNSPAMTKALKKKIGMYVSPTGSRHRIGSAKHQYWEGIRKRGEDNARAGVPND